MKQDHHYDDIINTHWPQPSSRESMPLENRAKIFMPFSAVKGLGKEIQQRIKKKMED
ncbi:MAG: hypothetical protein J6K76_08790 [Spirochaetaceae bacterium]|nr:hypothetical protein [Spirochaetaceae bacterium]